MRVKTKVLVGDYETTVYDAQKDTEVWASALVELGTEDVQIFGSIDDTVEYLVSLDCNIRLYYHNLKFDGSFYLSYLLRVGYKQAYISPTDLPTDIQWCDTKEMEKRSVKYSISSKGMWYTITIKTENGRIIEIRDSLKLLPFSVKKLGKDFKTKHRKLEMEYKGFRYPNCPISDQEREYIKNDVLVVKEALEIAYMEGHDKLTIGACCLHEFKSIYSEAIYDKLFPDLTKLEIDGEKYGSATADAYIRRSYKGGWCYVVKGKESRVYNQGITADVNSLYPSVMHSESGSIYPVGEPTFWKGNMIPEICNDGYHYYFVRIRTRFYLKEGKLPFIQIKGSRLYRGNECLESSDVYDPVTGRYCTHYYDTVIGDIYPAVVTLTLTMTDYVLLLEHYDVEDFEILDGCYFRAEKGIFDEYINKYRKIKQESEGAIRQLAKLFLNNLYGKMASSTDSSFKVARLDDEGVLRFITVDEHEKRAGYIPVGSAITSYARNFTIRAAQKNYYGVNSRGFIYADTDSIHCDLSADELIDIPVHDSNFCCWKLEATWDKAIFVRQKTYIEHVIAENLKPVEKPFYNIKCAGMGAKPKRLLELSFGVDCQTEEEKESLQQELSKLNDREKAFVSTHRDLTDFKVGLRVPSMLKPKQIAGGVLLVESDYQMRPM